ncbi:MliC family protein [Marinobacter sp.]|uniref:MliC family protein n=1 Tax=Marinobacter sp. TaxID=50741 RepID=UPI001B418DE4|nr:MliC family protein [Marinobacter sp.]MBQ0831035.1 MliC family protein [Marinobacter sp.]
MRIVVPLIMFVSTLLVSACASSPQSKLDAQASAHNYQCKSGETITATYPTTDKAKVQYKGNSHNMQIAVSASGARYVGDGLEWWTKGSGAGSEGTLLRHAADNTSGEIMELCTES